MIEMEWRAIRFGKDLYFGVELRSPEVLLCYMSERCLQGCVSDCT